MRRLRVPMGRRTTLLLATALVVVPAEAAFAGAARVEGSTVRFGTDRAEVNRVTVYADAGPGLVIEDAQNDVVAGAGCTSVTARRVRCDGPGITLLAIDTGGANDVITPRSSLPVRAELRGGSGNDIIRSGPLNDLIVGGTGGDTVSYVGRPQDVHVTLAGGADDGAAGEGDDVREMEAITGGNGFDTLIGTDTYGELLVGGPGDDRLEGRGGSDRLIGGPGNELLEGGPGNDQFLASAVPDESDTMRGGPGDDRADYRRRRGGVVADPDGFADDGERTNGDLRFLAPLPPIALLASPERDNILTDVESLRGGHGNDVLALGRSAGRIDAGRGTDVLYGGPGRDRLLGDAGFDRIVARDRAQDIVNCGGQIDRVYTRGGDSLAGDCERQSIRVPLRVTPVGRELDERGLRVRVTCPAQAYVRCAGRIRATTVQRLRKRNGRLRQAKLGGARLLASPGTVAEVVIPFGRVARRLIAQRSPLRVRIVVRGRDNVGRSQPAFARLVLRG